MVFARETMGSAATSWGAGNLKTGNESFDAQCAATVTQLLGQAGGGDPHAAAALLPLVYDQLRRLARRKLRQERPDQTLQPTALVHEAYMRLVDQSGGGQQWDGRWHFFAAAAEA